MLQRILDRIENHFGRYRGIRNLITFIVVSMAVVYVSDYVFAPTLGFFPSAYLMFDRNAILHGQIWRLITFIVVPNKTSLLFFIMQLLFLHFTGDLLQSHWGILRFNIFYLSGMLGSIIAGMITGYATSYYINLSLFLAVAILFPMMQVNFYGFIPLRMKWLAVIDLVLLIPGFLRGTWGERLCIIVSLLNVAFFFFDRCIRQVKEAKRRYEWKKSWRNGQWR